MTNNVEITENENKTLPYRGASIMALHPTTIDEQWRLAKAVALSGMMPKSYGRGNLEEQTAKAFTAMQLGAEVGMRPMQSIQNIAVINGMPCIWGDAQKAIVINHPECEYIKESFEGRPYEDDFRGMCKVKRHGHDEIIRIFSVMDAKRAGLWNKVGPWQTYTKRMLQYRARSFALRDCFPDALKGLSHSIEEMEDVTPVNDTKSRKISDVLDTPPDNETKGIPGDLFNNKITSSTTKTHLETQKNNEDLNEKK